jgi:hypothetical protein
MKLKLQKKLKELFDHGYQVKIYSPYVDSFVRGVSEDESGQLCYDSVVYSKRPLVEVPMSDVEVFQSVDNWQEVDLEA